MSRLLNLSVFVMLLPWGAFCGDNPPQACQVAVLRNGFTVRHVRREAKGAATRLWLCDDAGAGYVEIPGDQIERIDEEPGVTAAAPAAPTSSPATVAGAALPVKGSVSDLIASAALRHQIDADFLSSVVRAESGFNPKAVSPKGAQGLMQLMPQTAAGLGVADVLDPAANVEGGTRYLRWLLDRYNGDSAKALAAYNAGPQRVEQYGGVPPYAETRAYVARIIDDYNRKKLSQQAQPATTSADK